ncbi:MAG: Ig-like domain-containing protein, partial [Paludibacteraceae bacterium]|nr:Ig-like domain-containing protein [Paludibacteraceae bacterium]
MKKLYLKSALLLVLTVLVGLTSCKKDEFEKLSLSFSSSSVDIDENGYIGLKKYLVIQPSNLDTITVAWSSSDESVATVTKNGGVEGISSGTAIITASAYGKSATIKVNVTSLPIEGVTIPKTVNNIWVNVPYKLDGVELNPIGASLKRINWSDESGKLTFEYNEEENAWYVTATEAGTYNVKATADEHEAESTFTVKIKTIDSITLSETSLSLLSTGTESRTATLTYKIKPADASYQEVEWSA